jgi:hypothetical protein
MLNITSARFDAVSCCLAEWLATRTEAFRCT